jgi:antitoxin MazE
MILFIRKAIVECAMQVSKWGNSLAVRLPKKLVEELGIQQGDTLSILAARDHTIEVETQFARRKRSLKRMQERDWTRPSGFRFDREEANER